MNDNIPQVLTPPDADVVFYPDFFAKRDADRLFQELRDTSTWRQDSIKLFGRSKDLPRLTAWYGDVGIGYVYSGIENEPLAWTPAMMEVKREIESVVGTSFNGVLLNRYRTGRDSVSWHSDDEKEFGVNPVIASVSFGAARTFQLRHKKHKDLKVNLELTHGSLLAMRGTTQHHWVHQVPKTAKDVAERINLTFRAIQLEQK